MPCAAPPTCYASVTSPGLLFAGLDQCPQALLHHLRRGGVQGVQRHLQLVDAGADSLSLDSVMMGIDKNLPFPHLFKAHRARQTNVSTHPRRVLARP